MEVCTEESLKILISLSSYTLLRIIVDVPKIPVFQVGSGYLICCFVTKVNEKRKDIMFTFDLVTVCI